MLMLSEKITACCHTGVDSTLLCELWQGFCYGKSALSLQSCEETKFVLGTVAPVEVPQDKRYAIYISAEGVAVSADNSADLMQGILEMMRRIKFAAPEQGGVYLEDGVFYDTEDIGVRMVHLCVFPETTYEFMIKIIRLCGALHYTHVILEFWGTLQYDCMKELAWPGAFTKAQAKEMVSECRKLGMEPVPMFNHLGHASASRAVSGKHVVLDQNPTLAPYFSEDGWNWNIDSEIVINLLRTVRSELYEVFGDCEYFHLGVDECYHYGVDYNLSDSLCSFLTRICDEVLGEGSRPIIWGDMWLSHDYLGTTRSEYTCNCHDERIADKILTALDKRVVIADWQYHKSDEGTLITTPYLQEWGFDVICCPWEGNGNIKVNVNTARQCKAMGVMETTWHTLSKGFTDVWACAELCRADREAVNIVTRFGRFAAAALLRRVYPRFEGYENTGWARYQIPMDNIK